MTESQVQEKIVALVAKIADTEEQIADTKKKIAESEAKIKTSEENGASENYLISLNNILISLNNILASYNRNLAELRKQKFYLSQQEHASMKRQFVVAIVSKTLAALALNQHPQQHRMRGAQHISPEAYVLTNLTRLVSSVDSSQHPDSPNYKTRHVNFSDGASKVTK